MTFRLAVSHRALGPTPTVLDRTLAAHLGVELRDQVDGSPTAEGA